MKHHSRYPVELKMSWFAMFGKKISAMTDKHRRNRWEKWKILAVKNGDQDMVDYWSDHGECEDCIHKDGDWCKLSSLPVTINPILTMRHGTIGFACMEAGYEGPKQLEMNLKNNN